MSPAWSWAGGCAQRTAGARRVAKRRRYLVIPAAYRRSLGLLKASSPPSRSSAAPTLRHSQGGMRLAAGERGDRRIDHRLVGLRVELVADQGFGGGGGCRSGLGADLLERGALRGGDLVLGHAGAAL